MAAVGRRAVCASVPHGRPPAPAAAKVPAGPNVQDSSGKAGARRDDLDLLETDLDELLFEHYFTSQLAYVDASSGTSDERGASRDLRQGRPVTRRSLPARLAHRTAVPAAAPVRIVQQGCRDLDARGRGG